MSIETTVYGKENFKPKARYYLKNNDDLEILEQYNSEIRGFRNYYSLANQFINRKFIWVHYAV